MQWHNNADCTSKTAHFTTDKQVDIFFCKFYNKNFTSDRKGQYIIIFSYYLVNAQSVRNKQYEKCCAKGCKTQPPQRDEYNVLFCIQAYKMPKRNSTNYVVMGINANSDFLPDQMCRKHAQCLAAYKCLQIHYCIITAFTHDNNTQIVSISNI